MNIGIGLPISDPAALPDWARRADAGPFASSPCSTGSSTTTPSRWSRWPSSRAPRPASACRPRCSSRRCARPPCSPSRPPPSTG
ncbi:hypothetical protein ACFQHO_50645 [Actinomadura yumaensis]|uniref:hypothetical protein n=1 Tax=Actinomadura yumaensis TaxID=111807 RepID=UPI00361C638C